MTAARTQREKLAVVEKFSQSELVKVRKAETKGGKIKRSTPSPAERLARLLTEAQRLFEDYPKEALRPNVKEEYKRLREIAYDLHDGLTRIFALGALIERKEASA